MGTTIINKKLLKEWLSRPPEKALCNDPGCEFPHWIDIECNCGCGEVVPNTEENIHRYVKKWGTSKKVCLACDKEYKWDTKLWEDYKSYLMMQELPSSFGIIDIGEYCSKRCYDLALRKITHMEG